MKMKPWLVYTIGALGGLLFGIDSGLTSGVITPAEHYLNITNASMDVLIANVVTLGAGIMAIFAGKLNDKYGRKKMLISASVVFLIGACCCSFASQAGGTTLVLSRLVLGLGIGIASAVVPSYLAELAPAAIRSQIATLFQFAIVLGLETAYIIDFFVLPVVNGFAWMQHNFNVMLGCAAIPAIILFLGAIFMPESPRFLIKVGRVEEGKSVLLGMRNGDQAAADAEYNAIQEILSDEGQSAEGGYKDCFTIAKKPLIAAFGIAFLQQLVGINAAFYYGPVIAGSVIPHPYADAAAGSTEWIANLQQDQFYSIIFGIVNIVATILTIFAMKKISSYKKTLYLGGAIMCLFSVLFVIQALTHFMPDVAAIVLICLYIVGFAFSWGPLTWNILGEIFPLAVRGVGSSISAAVNWFANFVVMSAFAIIIIKDANGVAGHIENGFIVFAIGAILAIVFTIFCVPETKDKSLEDIEKYFLAQKKSSGDNAVLGCIIGALLIGIIVFILPIFGVSISPIVALITVIVASLPYIFAIVNSIANKSN
ncbi:MAG: sugar porter family MFS transporter [Candidatus Ancillula sp.]|jgi:sugar porter (SP) family MFS transporter|nr:sugar porter family MFS transporter [Candidatus Ancillula sp.]